MKKKSTARIPVVLIAVMMLLAALAAPAAFAAENIPVTIEIPITYIVNGNDETAGGDEFTLTADDPDAPMPEGSAGGKKTINIKKEGSYSFGNIYYDRPEVWWYTVSRSLTEKKGVMKDDSVYRVKVIALNDGHGYVLAYLEGSNEKHELVYTDRVAPETGDYSMLMIYAGLAAVAAAALTLLVSVRAINRRREA